MYMTMNDNEMTMTMTMKMTMKIFYCPVNTCIEYSIVFTI